MPRRAGQHEGVPVLAGFRKLPARQKPPAMFAGGSSGALRRWRDCPSRAGCNHLIMLRAMGRRLGEGVATCDYDSVERGARINDAQLDDHSHNDDDHNIPTLPILVDTVTSSCDVIPLQLSACL